MKAVLKQLVFDKLQNNEQLPDWLQQLCDDNGVIKNEFLNYLNPILDKAFDQGFITFHPEKHSLIISDKIKDEKTIEYLSPFENCILATPKHKSASPAKENLEYHNDVIFNSLVNKKGNNILYPELG